jgi:hypothetical protein
MQRRSGSGATGDRPPEALGASLGGSVICPRHWNDAKPARTPTGPSALGCLPSARGAQQLGAAS